MYPHKCVHTHANMHIHPYYYTIHACIHTKLEKKKKNDSSVCVQVYALDFCVSVYMCVSACMCTLCMCVHVCVCIYMCECVYFCIYV